MKENERMYAKIISLREINIRKCFSFKKFMPKGHPSYKERYVIL